MASVSVTATVTECVPRWAVVGLQEIVPDVEMVIPTGAAVNDHRRGLLLASVAVIVLEYELPAVALESELVVITGAALLVLTVMVKLCEAVKEPSLTLTATDLDPVWEEVGVQLIRPVEGLIVMPV